MNTTSAQNPLVYEGLDSFSQPQVDGLCQPFEFENCSTCSYSTTTESGTLRCSIRNRPVGRPNLSYCANHSTYNPGSLTTPIGPVRLVRHFHVGDECWYVSPSVKPNPDRIDGRVIVRLLEEIHRGETKSTLVVNRALAYEAAELDVVDAVRVLMQIASTSELGDGWWSTWLPFNEATRALSRLSKKPGAMNDMFEYAIRSRDVHARRAAARFLGGGNWVDTLDNRSKLILTFLREGLDCWSIGDTIKVAGLRTKQLVERLADIADEKSEYSNEGQFIRVVGGLS